MRHGPLGWCCWVALLVLGGRVHGQVEGAFAHPAAWGRAAVLGAAFTAVADDQGGLYWNPAGLARLERRYRAAFAHANVFDDLDLKHDLVSLVRSNNSWGGGVGLDRLGTSRVLRADGQGNIQGYTSYTETRFLLAVGKSFEGLHFRRDLSPPKFGLGVHLLEVESGGSTRRDLGLDAGWLVVWTLPQGLGLRLGAVVRNAYSTLDGAWSPVLSAALVRGGRGRRPLVAVGYRPRTGRWTLGLDVPLVPGQFGLGLSGAIESTSGVGTSWRLGLALGLGRGSVEYVLEDRPFLGRTQALGLDTSWGRYQFPLYMDDWRLQRSGAVASPARLWAAEKALLQVDFRYPIPRPGFAESGLETGPLRTRRPAP